MEFRALSEMNVKDGDVVIQHELYSQPGGLEYIIKDLPKGEQILKTGFYADGGLYAINEYHQRYQPVSVSKVKMWKFKNKVTKFGNMSKEEKCDILLAYAAGRKLEVSKDGRIWTAMHHPHSFLNDHHYRKKEIVDEFIPGEKYIKNNIIFVCIGISDGRIYVKAPGIEHPRAYDFLIEDAKEVFSKA